MFEELDITKEERDKYRQVLLGKRVLFLEGIIKEGEVNQLLKWLQILNNESNEGITLYINSSGGDAHAALWLYDALRISPAPITGIVNGRCESMAVIILQGCKKRKSTKHCRFHIHPISTTLLKLGNEKAIKKALEEGRKTQNYIYQILSEKTRKTISEIKRKENQNLWAEEAKELGLIDEVI